MPSAPARVWALLLGSSLLHFFTINEADNDLLSVGLVDRSVLEFPTEFPCLVANGRPPYQREDRWLPGPVPSIRRVAEFVEAQLPFIRRADGERGIIGGNGPGLQALTGTSERHRKPKLG